MILLDYQDRRPLYEQIVEKYRLLILKGVLSSGERMPSVRQLAVELSINPNTIQRAYMELEQQGLIYPVKGKGNYVADSRELQEISRKDYEKELKGLVFRGRELGFSQDELIYFVRTWYKEGRK